MKINGIKLKKYIKNTAIVFIFVLAIIGALIGVGIIPWEVYQKLPFWLSSSIVACCILSILISLDQE